MMDNLLLAVDTSTQVASVALYDGVRVRAEMTWESFRRHTVELTPRVVAMLNQVGADASDLTGLVVALGLVAAGIGKAGFIGGDALQQHRREGAQPFGVGQVIDQGEAVAAGDWAARVPGEGTRETADLADSFNTMTETLEGRTEALEKAVAELRGANRDLRRARAGLDRAERLAAVGSLAAGAGAVQSSP